MKNSCVERANRIHAEEFYEVHDCQRAVNALNKQLLQREQVYNTIRRRPTLSYLTPLRYFKQRGIVSANLAGLEHAGEW